MSEAAQPGTRELDRAPLAGSSVPCPLKGGAQIAMGRCVEWQQQNGCHCEHALVALRRVAEHLTEEPARVGRGDGVSTSDHLADVEAARVEQLDEVRGLLARAEAIEAQRPAPAPKPPAHRKPPPQPAADEVAAAVLAQRKPAPKATEKKLCVGGCGSLFASPTYDKCWRCRVGLKSHRCDAPDAPQPEAKAAGATAAEEKPMPPVSPIKNVSDAEFRKAYEEEAGSIIGVAQRYGAAAKSVRKRILVLGLKVNVGGHLPKERDPAAPAAAKPAPAARPPRTVEDIAAKHAAPAGDDVVVLLEQKRAFHVAQAERIGRAIEALRD